jgi:hypothetical protein
MVTAEVGLRQRVLCERDVELLERLGENTRACVGMYGTRTCLTD